MNPTSKTYLAGPEVSIYKTTAFSESSNKL